MRSSKADVCAYLPMHSGGRMVREDRVTNFSNNNNNEKMWASTKSGHINQISISLYFCVSPSIMRFFTPFQWNLFAHLASYPFF